MHVHNPDIVTRVHTDTLTCVHTLKAFAHTFTTVAYSCLHTYKHTHMTAVIYSYLTCTPLPLVHSPRYAHTSAFHKAHKLRTRMSANYTAHHSHSHTHTPYCSGSPRPPFLLLTHNTGQDHNAEAEAEGGQGPGLASREQHFWGLCPCVLSALGWGRGRLHSAEPSPGRLPTPFGRDFRERGPGDTDNQRLCPPLLASLLPTLPAPCPDR